MNFKENDGNSPDLLPILSAAAAGDEAAWTEVVKLYGRRLYALAKSRCKDGEVAEEITQSVFATIAEKLGGGQYQEQGKFESWLFRVAMNRIRDHVRRLKRRSDVQDSQLLVHAEAPAASNESSDDPMLGRLKFAMSELSDADREIVELRHHGGMSFKEMADLLDEPVGTLLARHHRALKKLKELIETSGIESGVGEAKDSSDGESHDRERGVGRKPAQGKREVVS